MLKQCLVSLHYTNYITKILSSTACLKDQLLKFHNSFTTEVLIQNFSGPEKSKDEFQDFSELLVTLEITAFANNTHANTMHSGI